MHGLFTPAVPPFSKLHCGLDYPACRRANKLREAALPQEREPKLVFHTFPDTRIFDAGEQESLEAHRYVAPYAGITKARLIGLLWALAEYMMRSTPDPTLLIGTVSNDLEFVAAHRSLFGAYRRLKGPDTNGSSSSGQAVFDTQERHTMSFLKYVRGYRNFSKQDVREFLEALGQYCLIAPRIKQRFGPIQADVRLVHAHNALLSFRDRPFTVDEFRASVRAVLSGESSLIAKSNGGECEIA